ncbi:MAG: hypothetical protein WAU71_09325 [Pyrinomonadaceae bacterium]
MRKRDRDKIVEILEVGPKSNQGTSIFVRPYESDLKKIVELSQDTGEAKSAIARKLIQRALSENHWKAEQDRVENKLDWLISTSRDNEPELRRMFGQIEDLNEKTEATQETLKTVSENVMNSNTLIREFYCMLSVTISSLNQIFTKLLEFSSPNQTEREHSVDIGNAALANLIAHSIVDLHKCAAFHALKLDTDSEADLYVGTKIQVLTDRINRNSKQKAGVGDKIP